MDEKSATMLKLDMHSPAQQKHEATKATVKNNIAEEHFSHFGLINLSPLQI